MFRALLLSAALVGSPASSDPLAAYQWRNRVLVVFAPRPTDRRLLDQRAAVLAMSRNGGDRDLVTVEPAASAASQFLRRRLAISRSSFTVVLIGKDGEVKLKANKVISQEALASVIDAMPMRRDEIRRRNTGS